MITDRENMFCENLAVTASGTVGDVVKVTSRMRKQNLDLFIQNQSAINNATSFAWKFVSSAASDLSSPTTIADSGAIALATLNAAGGYRYVAPFSTIPLAHKYVGLVATLVGTAPTTGGITAGIVETAVLDTSERPTYYTGR